MPDTQFGLIFKKAETEYYSREYPVPLKSVSVDVSVKGYVADVTSTLVYKHQETEPVEAAFVFPLDEGSAIYYFQAEIQGRKIVGECQTKEEAQATYDNAVESGHTAFLMNQEKTSDVFRIIIGNLPPNEEASIKFSYVLELPIQVDDSVKFTLPTVLNPRYGDAGGSNSRHAQPIGGTRTDAEYKLELTATIDAGDDKIAKFSSNSDQFEKVYNETKSQLKATLKTKNMKFDHDIEFFILYGNTRQPHVVYEEGSQDSSGFMKQDAVMLSFFPEFPETSSNITAGEYIFIVDRSGSMSGGRIKSASETLLLFLKSLPVGCYFNILSFGSRHELLFRDGSQPYSEDTLQRACDLQRTMEADFGGTEIHSALSTIYRMSMKPGHPRQLFLLTDGDVWNTEDVIKLVQSNAATTRVFAFGIGEGASTALVKGIARAGRGKYEFVKNSDKLQSKVMSVLKSARQDFVSDIAVKWTLPGDNNAVVIPKVLPPLFSGQSFIIYALLKHQVDAGASGQVTLTWKVGEKPMSHDLEVKRSDDSTSLTTVHRLAAKKKIQELQAESDDDKAEERKKAIILLSTSANIVSNHTSFVAVDKEAKVNVTVKKGVPPPEPVLREYCLLGDAMACNGSFKMSRPLSKTKSLFSKIGSKFKKKSAPRADMYFQERSARPPPPPGAAMAKRAAVVQDAESDSDEDDDIYMCSYATSPSPKNSSGRPIPTSGDTMMQVIDLQKFDGHWELEASLLVILGKKQDELEAGSPVKDKNVWTTALVVAWLETVCAKRQDEWEMIHDKALSWLKSQSAVLDGKTTEELIQVAKKLLA